MTKIHEGVSLSRIHEDLQMIEATTADTPCVCDECNGVIGEGDIYHAYFYEEGDIEFSNNDYFCQIWLLCLDCEEKWRILELWGWERFEDSLEACLEEYNSDEPPEKQIKFLSRPGLNQEKLFDPNLFIRFDVIGFTKRYLETIRKEA